jgi:hypothetical protein
MNNQLKQHIKEASVKTEQEASIELIKKEVIVSSEEITSLRFSLEQAHKVIKGLQVALDEEKTKKDEIEKLLYESQETIEEIQHCTTPLDSNIGSPHWPLDISTVRDDTNISSQSSLSQPLIPDDDNSSSTSHSNTASSWKTDRRPTLNDEILNVENARLLENSKRCVNQNNLNHYGSFYKENAHRTSEEGGFKMITNEKEENLNSTNITCNIEENPNHPFSDINENDFNKVDLPAIMQTMIGEWLYKYVRNRVGQGISANYHRRFFWLHPYTRILYWCTQEPGTEGEWKAKSGK